MLAYRLRRWPKIKLTLGERLVFFWFLLSVGQQEAILPWVGYKKTKAIYLSRYHFITSVYSSATINKFEKTFNNLFSDKNDFLWRIFAEI